MTPWRPAPGTPYHRMARTDAHRWWLPPAATAAVAAGTAAAVGVLLSVRSLVGLLTGRSSGPADEPDFGPIGETALLLLVVAAALPVVLVVARSWQQRPAGTLTSVEGRVRWRWLTACLLIAVPAVWFMLAGFSQLLDLTGEPTAAPAAWVGWPKFAASLSMLLLLVPLQTAAEEYVFRGWLLQAVGAFVHRPWLAIGPQAVLFATAHGWGTPWGFLDLLTMGLVCGWLTVRTGGLEAAVALHLVNNLIAYGGVAALGLLGSAGTAADAPWQLCAVSVLALAGYALAVRWQADRRGIAARTRPAGSKPAGSQPAGSQPAPRSRPAGWRGAEEAGAAG
ncbi:CPBP family intramembrane metalloprotease [Solwaraspora sp. WMMD1047]|uniref:CPBP family intramembrane glutamic endopeptidase n=1 Tax=Solwaraspora sp. WMMD1047 TaxID=3016102 RepID=UPI0024161E1E|nr:CPBP family intramembrane glutamic endopeptidase [Solwaraspora sp. WMMD1047]MDG4829767.1 CPBP family intramembrane metalloprotease [Solwaraspora sp. WMMD1047]